ncbi:MAG: FG-GAP-like repeat-containing protein [Gemmatimonadaceae bacterium]
MKTASTLTLLLLLFVAPTMAAQSAGPPPTPPKFIEAQQLVRQLRFSEALPLLREVLQVQPLYGPAWMSLAAAHRALGATDSAVTALQRAITRPGVARDANLQLMLLYIDANRLDDASGVLNTVKTSGMDFTTVRANPQLEKVRGDARFALFFPTPADLARPFVEKVRIIHEWHGEAAGDEFGWIARGIGDVDKDGVTDVAVSAASNPPLGSAIGKVYAYSGKSGKLLWKVEGPKGSFLGSTVEGAGDTNKDGIPDVVVGAPGINGFYIYSGIDGRELRKTVGDSSVTDLGRGVAGVGDLNHDGYGDILASAPGATIGRGANTGRVYVFSGKNGKPLLMINGDSASASFGSTLGVGGGRYFVVGASGGGLNGTGRIFAYDRLNPIPLFTQDADSTGAALGAMFASVVGDVNGDGIPDMYATDFANSANGPASGRAYIFSGKTGEKLFVKSGEFPGEGFGIGAGRTGDVNGDGRADFLVGGWQYSGAAWSGGRVQVFSGKDGSVLQTFTGRVPGETLGFDAVGVGDVDGDGTTDYLLTSAWSTVNGLRSGRVYIVSGSVLRRSRD